MAGKWDEPKPTGPVVYTVKPSSGSRFDMLPSATASRWRRPVKPTIPAVTGAVAPAHVVSDAEGEEHKVLDLEPAGPNMKWFEAMSRRALAGAEAITGKVNSGEWSQQQGFDAFSILVDVVFPWITGETKETFDEVKRGWREQLQQAEVVRKTVVVSDLPPDEVW